MSHVDPTITRPLSMNSGGGGTGRWEDGRKQKKDGDLDPPSKWKNSYHERVVEIEGNFVEINQ